MSVEIHKLKVLNDGGLKIEYDIRKEVDGFGYAHIKNDISSPVTRSQDIDSELSKLKYHLLRSNFMMGLGLQARAVKDLSTSDQKSLLGIINKIEINSVTITRDDEGNIKGAKISGDLVSFGNKKISIHTPYLPFDSSDYQFTEDLQTQINNLESLVENYLDTVGVVQLKLQF